MTEMNDVADRIALCEAKARYCRLLDTKDWDGFADLFVEDYELDVSDATNVAVIKGRDAAMAMTRAALVDTKTCHHIHSPEITITGDVAKTIWAMQDRVVRSDGRASFTGYGHYHERWVRRNGEWKIATLKLTRLFLDMDGPVAAQS